MYENITTEQAKALAFDELVKIETAQNNLRLLNKIIHQEKTVSETVDPVVQS